VVTGTTLALIAWLSEGRPELAFALLGVVGLASGLYHALRPRA